MRCNPISSWMPHNGRCCLWKYTDQTAREWQQHSTVALLSSVMEVCLDTRTNMNTCELAHECLLFYSSFCLYIYFMDFARMHMQEYERWKEWSLPAACGRLFIINSLPRGWITWISIFWTTASTLLHWDTWADAWSQRRRQTLPHTAGMSNHTCLWEDGT